MNLITAFTPERLRARIAYDSERVNEIFAGRSALLPVEILDLDIPADDRLRIVLRAEVMGERDLRLAGCDIVERVLPLYEAERPGDHRPRQAIETARRFAHGEATAWELYDATVEAGDCWKGASVVARQIVTAVVSASQPIGWCALFAAFMAAESAGRDGEREAQIEILRGYLSAR